MKLGRVKVVFLQGGFAFVKQLLGLAAELMARWSVHVCGALAIGRQARKTTRSLDSDFTLL